MSAETTPLPVGTVVDYHGSHTNGRYVVTAHEAPREGVEEPEVNYPDGVAYALWPTGLPVKMGLRHLSVVQVRRESLTAVLCPGGCDGGCCGEDS